MNINEVLCYYPTNHPLLAVGEETVTYNMGKIVPCVVVEAKASQHKNIYGPEYKVRYTGKTEVCLDLGQNWYLKPGDVFVCHQNNIDHAIQDRRTIAGRWVQV